MLSVLFRMCGESDDEFVKEEEVNEEEVKREDVNEDEIKIEIKEEGEKEGKRKIRVAVAGCVHGEIDKVITVFRRRKITVSIEGVSNNGTIREGWKWQVRSTALLWRLPS